MNTNKYQLDTPCLVINKQKLLNNLDKMQREVSQQNKAVRPHIKTHKCTEIAKLQIQYGAIGVSAAKISEVTVLAKSGIKNILLTSPVVTQTKINNLIQCLKLDSELIVTCDSKTNAMQLSDAANAANLKLNVLVDIDPGIARTGVNPDSAIDLAKYIHNQCENLELRGIQCYAGNLQHIHSYEERKKASSSIMQQASKIKSQFTTEGLPCNILSGSGTGTYDVDIELQEVTEVQPGSYTVMDMEYSNIGSKENTNHYKRFEAALTMLVTVISANHTTHVTVDAGTKSIYFDASTKPLIISHPGLQYDWNGFGDEHGKITAEPETALPKVGEVLELIVPHCDPTINLHDRFYVTEKGLVTDCWDIDMRGCVK